MIKNFSKSAIGILILALSILSSCTKLEEVLPEKSTEASNSKIYLIEAGAHSSSHGFSLATDSILNFKAVFDSSAIYETEDVQNQKDINKLYGVADCGSHHHENSARFGWRWLDGKLEIHAYTYTSGARKSKFITSVALNKEITYTLQLTLESYIYTVGNTSISMERACSDNTSGYKLYPYFGGDETAPHDITIAIEDVVRRN